MRSGGRAASAEEQAVLARWSGWGALPGVFDEADGTWADTRQQLRSFLDDEAWDAARRTTINAHYTSAEVVQAVWRAVSDLGFRGGRVLEPGCGSGNFIGLAPAGLPVEVVGVELDPTTAAIAAALYPEAEIRADGFERTRFPEGSFGLVVGNVPFGRVVLVDDAFNRSGHSIHNHFLLKALRLTAGNGLVATLTSRYTLDARNPAARREMASLADLVGAVRLPAAAFRATAGTDAVTDLLILRRREDGAPDRSEPWDRLAIITTEQGEVEVNGWFARHPELVLGVLRPGHGHYRRDETTVVASGRPLGPLLDVALGTIVARGRDQGLEWGPPARRVEAERDDPHPPASGPGKEGSILVDADGRFARVVAGVARGFEPRVRSDRAELLALVQLRDALLGVLDAQSSTDDDAAFESAQEQLNRCYDAYAARWGPLNRFSLAATGRTDPSTGAPTYRRLRPRMGGFPADPDFPSVLALEVFDPDTQTATKAPVFRTRVVAPREARRGAETPEDALTICLDEHGRADLGLIADLLGVEPAQAREELGALVWDDPATGDLVPAAAYLSGDVRQKLEQAEAAATDDPRYARNVEALRAVVPADIAPEEIDVRPGAAWIPTSDVADFAREVFGCTGVVVDHAAVTSTWAVQVPTYERRSVATTSTWGTARADAASLLQSSLNQQAAVVYDQLDDGSRVLNPAETFAAREKQEAIEARFASWIWDEPARAVRLARRYNQLFNSTVVPRYDGSHLSLPGLSCAFQPRPHQRDAVWRILQEPSVLLAHAVGAGKTATMIIGGMELRRLGLARKVAHVVPNHMLGQYSNELIQLYPQAKVLVATKADATPEARKEFVARCATGDWDAIVVTRSAFERIPVSQTTRRTFLKERMRELREAVAASNGLTVKRLELAMARLEERHKRLMAEGRKDDGVTFEASGIDYVYYDEAHALKGRQFPTRIQGVGGAGSQRAEDMELKLAYLRSRHGERVATFATATPIANSLAEMYVMQSYLQPEAMTDAGVAQFDAWAANFGRTIAALELAPDGASYRLTSRFARFRNVPELLTMFHSVADVRTAEDLRLPTPTVVGGRAETVVVDPTPGLREYVGRLADRAERVRNRMVLPEEDNMLKISGDGRKAALDLRLVGMRQDGERTKVVVAAERIASIYHDTRELGYRDPSGTVSGGAGALQIVFCELGTPKGDGGWSVYGELRRGLADRGVPERLVRFVHEAGDDRAKAELFAACREGRVAVLVGSTEKMGVGTNIQARLIALHHLDCPWRPGDIEQREGRALRQGNQNPAVHIIRYVTEGSFDVFMFQTVERKAAFIHQVMRGNVTGREIDDIGEQALSYAEVKALATGNPLLMEKAGIDNEIARLTRLRRAHQQDRARLARTVEAAETRIARLAADIAECQAAIDRRVETKGDRFRMVIGDTTFDTRVEAGAELKRVLSLARSSIAADLDVGQLAGFRVVARVDQDRLGSTVQMRLSGSPVRLSLAREELERADPAGLVQRLEHRVRDIENVRDEATSELVRMRGESGLARSRLGAPFEHDGRLALLTGRQAEIDAALTAPTDAPINLASCLATTRPAQHTTIDLAIGP